MRQYYLEVQFDALEDEEYLALMLEMKYGGFKYSFGRSMAPPHKMRFEFQGLSEEGVDKLKTRFRAMKLRGGSFTTIEVVG